MKIEWSPRAEREITQIKHYISQDSPFYAKQFTVRLIMAAEKLLDFPRRGRLVPEAGYQESIREIIFQGYRIIYRIHSDALLQIITVLHGAQDLTSMQPAPSLCS